MQQDLSAASSSGTQTTTQDPQSATSSTLTPTSSSLQSNSVNLFEGGSGISLKPSSPSTVNLQSTIVAKSSSPAPTIKHHHVNGVLLGIFIVIFVVAIAVFWQTTKSAKNTTD